MATLDNTSFEALAFFAVVNNLWTWIAAVVSFWRMRVTTTNIKDGYNLLEELTEPESITGPVEETVARVEKVVTKTATEPLMSTEDGVTKGKKLTMYYEVDVDGGGECDDGEITDVDYGYGSDCGEWWEKWEKVMKMRNGDDSWYRYIDLTVINGNVVRLWGDNGVCNGAR